MQKLITITTDFGDQFAVSQLHAVLASYGFSAKVIENHKVTPFSIVEGAFQIKILSDYCPKDTVHVGVVDPGVGSSRDSIIIKSGQSYFVGPNNGLLFPGSQGIGARSAWKINESFFGKNISSTFHGRDVFIKVAALLAKDINPDNIGCSILKPNFLVKLYFKKGQVLHIDRYGNIKVHWNAPIIAGNKLQINGFSIPIVKTFSDTSKNRLIAYLGSSKTLELAINQGNANNKLKLKVGDILKIE